MSPTLNLLIILTLLALYWFPAYIESITRVNTSYCRHFCVRAWKVFVAASRLNQLLAEWGFLRFRREPSRSEDAVVDWGRSLAVAWGGYYARVFINAVGEEAVEVKRELKRKFSVLKAPWGHIRNAVFELVELYRAVRGDAPDGVFRLSAG